MRGKQRLRKRDILVMVTVAVAVLVGIFFFAQWLEDSNAQPEPEGDYHNRLEAEKVTINGKDYRPKNNLTTILLMGIDKDSDEPIVANNRDGGASDFMRLIVIDPSEKKVSQIAIDRDTMTPVTILSVLGNRTGVRTLQITLAHAMGDGKEKSCELAVEAVSNLLLNTPISFYIAMNMDGISMLNDSVGGITMTLQDDFSSLDPAMTQGATLTLQGKQAELFVRSRMSMSIGTNEARMARQEEYLDKLMEALYKKIKSSNSFIGDLFDGLTPYLCTNMSRARIVNESWAARDYARPAAIQLKGEHITNSQERTEFHVDEDALEQVVLDVFYEQLK